MCDEETGLPVLDNAEEMEDLTVVVTMRGQCTFGEKALVARDEGAIGILFVNNQEGLFHPSAPEARDIGELFATMISPHDGAHLINALRRNQARRMEAETTAPALHGRFIPMWCQHSNSDSDYCRPVSDDDARYESSLSYRGKLYADHGVEFDYVHADFGLPLLGFEGWPLMVPSVIGGDAHCCDRSGFEGRNEVTNSTALLCLRGDCDFVTKAENVALATGGGMIIVSSYVNSTLTRMGSDPAIRGRKVQAAAIMVSSDAYEDLVSHFYTSLDHGATLRCCTTYSVEMEYDNT